MFEILRDEIWQLRNGLFKDGRYTPPVACDPWPERLRPKSKMKLGNKSEKWQKKKTPNWKIGKPAKRGTHKGKKKVRPWQT